MREESKELKVELNQTKTELVNCENQLQQALQSISSPAVVSCENEAQTMEKPPTVDPEPGEPEPEPTPEPETENTESPAVETEPLTVNSEPPPEEPEPDTTEALQTEAQPKLYNPGQLAKWINENCNPDKKISDQNVRDWFNPKKNSDKKRTEVQEKYGFRLDHKDKKGTLWFTVG